MPDSLPLAVAADAFPVLAQTVHGHPLAYLDNAATTQVPRPVLAAMRRFEEFERANIHRGVHTLNQRATDAFEQARTTLEVLSGGERGRLMLARALAKPSNLLVLDEPTNDLDIETLELLEALLQDYSGTVFLVSHDRTFLDNVVTSTLAFEGNGVWREYEGGVQDWLIQSKRSRELKSATQLIASPAISTRDEAKNDTEKPTKRGAGTPAGADRFFGQLRYRAAAG